MLRLFYWQCTMYILIGSLSNFWTLCSCSIRKLKILNLLARVQILKLFTVPIKCWFWSLLQFNFLAFSKFWEVTKSMVADPISCHGILLTATKCTSSAHLQTLNNSSSFIVLECRCHLNNWLYVIFFFYIL